MVAIPATLAKAPPKLLPTPRVPATLVAAWRHALETELRLSGIVELFEARAFALGLAYGGVGFLVAATIGTLGRRALDLAALVFVAAAWLAVRGAWGPELASYRVLAALTALALGGVGAVLFPRLVRPAARHPNVVAGLFAVPGAVLLAMLTPLVGGSVARSALAASTIAIAVAVRDFDAVAGKRGASWLLFAVTAAGVYLAVPDTELARAMLGAAVPFALLSFPKPLCRIGPVGSASLAGLFCWVVYVGGRGRPGSVVGGLATIGILAAEPAGRHLFPSVATKMRLQRADQDWIPFAMVVTLAQIALAAYASRVVASVDTAGRAMLVLFPALVVAVIGTPMLYPDSQPFDPQAARARRRKELSRMGVSRRRPGAGRRDGAPPGR